MVKVDQKPSSSKAAATAGARLVYCDNLVPFGRLQTDVDDLCTAFDLPPCDFDRLIPLTGHHHLAKLPEIALYAHHK